MPKWISELASTNFKIVVGAFMSLCTMAFYFIGTILNRPIDSVNFGLWLGYVAAWAGLSYVQFAKKRETYAAPSPDSERAEVPVPPAPTTPVPATPPTPQV
jgi:hypothetical protein